MRNQITPDDIGRFLDQFVENLAGQKDFIEIPALKTLQANMDERIHNKGQDSEGNRIGIKRPRGPAYSKRHAKARLQAGRQIGYIDLEFHGDSRRNFKVQLQRDRNAIGFASEVEALKADKLEGLMKTAIWKPTGLEVDESSEVGKFQINRAAKRSLEAIQL